MPVVPANSGNTGLERGNAGEETVPCEQEPEIEFLGDVEDEPSITFSATLEDEPSITFEGGLEEESNPAENSGSE